MSDPQHTALLTAARAWVEAERASTDAKAAVYRAHEDCEHTNRDTHGNCVHAEVAFERAYRAALAAQKAVLAEARKAVIAAPTPQCFECDATGATAPLKLANDGNWECEDEVACAERCEKQRNEEAEK